MSNQAKFILQQALHAFNSKNYPRARSLLDIVIKLQPNNAYAYNLAGLVCINQGQYTDSLNFFKKATQLKPRDFEIQFNLARALADIGDFKQSIEILKKCIDLNPNTPEVWLSYGVVLSNLNLFLESLSAFDKAINLNPNYAEAWNNKGNCLYQLEQYSEALDCYSHACLLNPKFAIYQTNKGNALFKDGKFTEALDCYLYALKQDPNFFQAMKNCGVTLFQLKRYESSIEFFDRILKYETDSETISYKAMALHEMKFYAEALNHYDIALKINPRDERALLNKGNAFFKLSLFEDALSMIEQSIAINPNYAEAYSSKAGIYLRLKRFHDAFLNFEQALKIKSSSDYILGDYLNCKMQVCSWEMLNDLLNRCIAKTEEFKPAIAPFYLLSLTDNPELHKKCSEIYVNKVVPPELFQPFTRQSKCKKIKIGYYSADFHNHATSYLIAELFEKHNKDKFELHAFSYGPNPNDEMRIRLTKSFDHFHVVTHLSDAEIVTLSRDVEIDIGIDLKGFTQDSRTRIFSLRAAPIQVNYLGYPGTMSASYIDYIIADQIVIPEEARKFYSEKIAYMPNCYQINDSTKSISNQVFLRRDFGLPDEAFVFCCFNNNFKILPQMLKIWARILDLVDHGVIWLLEDNPDAAINLKNEFSKAGIDSGRIFFAPRIPLDQHLSRHRLADLFLDTFPYNAHTTASDSLWAGLPILTLPGKSFASRVSASLLQSINLPELIVSSESEYVELAINLAKDPEKLRVIKNKLFVNRLKTPLFNSTTFTRNLEDLYIKMFENYQNNRPPIHLV